MIFRKVGEELELHIQHRRENGNNVALSMKAKFPQKSFYSFKMNNRDENNRLK